MRWELPRSILAADATSARNSKNRDHEGECSNCHVEFCTRACMRGTPAEFGGFGGASSERNRRSMTIRFAYRMA